MAEQLSLLARPAAAPGVRARASAAVTYTYESGAASGRRSVSWRPPSTTANDAILWNLTTIRNRSRSAIRNDGNAAAIVDTLVSNLIGTGIVPLSQAADPELAAQIQAAFEAWSTECDADGLNNFYGLQELSTRIWLEAGESFVRLRKRLPEDGLSVPLQLQVLEPELCPHEYNLSAVGGNRVRAGVEFDGIGRRTAYYFHPSRPELDDFDRSQYRRVDAASVVHLYKPTRATQLRGLPVLTKSLIRLHGVDRTDDAALLRQEIQNLFAGFITRDPSGPDDNLDPLTNQPRDLTRTPSSTSLEPGTLQELAPGEKIEFANPGGSPVGYKDFINAQLRSACVAAGVPYELVTGDMGSLNDRTMRVILNHFKRSMTMWQHQVIVHRFCVPIWRQWFMWAWVSGAITLPSDFSRSPEQYMAVKWIPPRWAYLHPVQDIEADIAAVRAGFTSRSDVVSEWGEDAALVDLQQERDNQRADTKGLRYSSDARYAASGPKVDPAADPSIQQGSAAA